MKRLIPLGIVMLLLALPAAAQNALDWSTVGSAAVLDEGQIGVYAYTGAALEIKATSVGTAEARFPVTNTVGSNIDISPAWTTLSAALVDNHSAGSVTATLYKVDKCSNVETQLCQIVSTDGDSNVRCETCTFTGGLDFANYVYYVHVVLAKTDVPPVVALHELAIY